MRLNSRPEYAQKGTPLTVPRGTSVRAAISQMCERNYGAVVVLEPDGTVGGIFTERDLMRRVANEGGNPDTVAVEDVMTTGVKVAKESDDVVDWLRFMSNERFRHLPVVDEAGRVVQMLSQGDFVSYTWPELLHQAGDKARQTLVPNPQVAIIICGVLAYALLVPVLFGML